MLKFQDRGDSKTPKKIYTSHLGERLESHMAFIVFIASVTINYYCLIKKRLESHFLSNYHQDLETQLHVN